MIRKIIGPLFFALVFHGALAQQKVSLAVLSKSKADGVWLRWAPADPSLWQLGNKYGYTIERFTLAADGDMEAGSRTLLTPAPLKPLTEAEFDQIAATSDEASVLQELLYGKEFNQKVSANDLSAVLARNNELENR